MAQKLVWSPLAAKDIEAIADYIEQGSAFYAGTVVAKINAVIESLVDFTWAGRVVPELEDKMIRERFVYSYRIIYRVFSDHITIATIIHGSRLLEPMKEAILSVHEEEASYG